ncbi:hypothetical protein B0H13DRAFT_1882272 [Mycena leptocephala]|nr:hypothetical protein B0H13DRAFT_1882272 [Mycena leptocephala]
MRKRTDRRCSHRLRRPPLKEKLKSDKLNERRKCPKGRNRAVRQREARNMVAPRPPIRRKAPSVLTAHYGERPPAARREMTGEYKSVPPRVEDGKERNQLAYPPRSYRHPKLTCAPAGVAGFPSTRTRPNQLTQRVQRDGTMAISPPAPGPRLYTTSRPSVTSARRAGAHNSGVDRPTPRSPAPVPAPVFISSDARLLRILTPCSTSTQAFGFDKEESGEGEEDSVSVSSRREVRRRGVDRNRGIGRPGWSGEWIAEDWGWCTLLFASAAARGRNVGTRVCAGTGGRLETSGTRSALALAKSARGARIEENDATPVYGIDTTGFRWSPRPTDWAQRRVRTCCHELPEHPQRRRTERQSIHTRAVLILVLGLVVFQGVNVSEVESEAARAKRCQRKKGDIGQRGARKRRSGELQASEKRRIHRDVTQIQYSKRREGVQSGIFGNLVRADRSLLEKRPGNDMAVEEKRRCGGAQKKPVRLLRVLLLSTNISKSPPCLHSALDFGVPYVFPSSGPSRTDLEKLRLGSTRLYLYGPLQRAHTFNCYSKMLDSKDSPCIFDLRKPKCQGRMGTTQKNVSGKLGWNTALKNTKGMFFPRCLGVTIELVLRQTPPVIFMKAVLLVEDIGNIFLNLVGLHHESKEKEKSTERGPYTASATPFCGNLPRRRCSFHSIPHYTENILLVPGLRVTYNNSEGALRISGPEDSALVDLVTLGDVVALPFALVNREDIVALPFTLVNLEDVPSLSRLSTSLELMGKRASTEAAENMGLGTSQNFSMGHTSRCYGMDVHDTEN